MCPWRTSRGKAEERDGDSDSRAYMSLDSESLCLVPILARPGPTCASGFCSLGARFLLIERLVADNEVKELSCT